MSVQTETAQALIQEIRAFRQKIPNLVVPTTKGERKQLASAAAVSADFVERIAVAVEGYPMLVRVGAIEPEKAREMMSYAEAFGPLADELEALAYFVRHSVTSIRSKAGSDALITYALARKLAARPEHADLAVHVADMRRTLGPRGRRKAKQDAPEQPPATTPPPTPPKQS